MRRPEVPLFLLSFDEEPAVVVLTGVIAREQRMPDPTREVIPRLLVQAHITSTLSCVKKSHHRSNFAFKGLALNAFSSNFGQTDLLF